ncbi:hypothetical protein HN827_06660 [archaeon]|jgi:hypothetical protein|nr:hypothetical protein [archaeon]MBT4648486.1 hypothetical protein [archaeon]MBT6821616.1 hypothetical protein [archaeon]MBT7392484.1 hypothetical protein [archaeon]
MKSPTYNIADEDLQSFHKDLILLINISKGIDKEYNEARREFIHDFIHFKKLLGDWNKKYPNLLVSHKEDGMQIKLRIFINSKSLFELFSESASRIPNLTVVNGVPINHAKIEAKDFSDINFSTKLSINYIDQENKNNSLTFKLVKDFNLIELYYNYPDMFQKTTPEFEICAYYALKQFDPKINIKQYGKFMCFDTDKFESEFQGLGWQRKYNFIK